jgi:hypothetical protein
MDYPSRGGWAHQDIFKSTVHQFVSDYEELDVLISRIDGAFLSLESKDARAALHA